MMRGLLGFCIRERLLVLLAMLAAAAAGWMALQSVPLDAIPNVGENQVIVLAEWAGRSPRDMEDQVTYPLSVLLQAVPGARSVRGRSMSGFSFVQVTFDDSVVSHATFVAPLLKKFGFGATFFITEGFEFTTDKEHYLTWAQIKALHADGFEIGNHTRDHKGVTEKSIPDLAEQLVDLGVAFGLVAALPDVERLHHDVADLAARVQRRDGVLEDHLHACASGAKLVVREAGELLALEHHRTTFGCTQLHHGTTSGALTAAALAHEAERFAAQHVETDTADGVHLEAGAAHGELDEQILNAEDDIGAVAQVRLSSAGHQAAPAFVASIRARASWYSGEPTGYQHA